MPRLSAATGCSERYTDHCIRHTLGTNMNRMGYAPVVIQNRLRLRSLTTPEWYTGHKTANEMEEENRAVNRPPRGIRITDSRTDRPRMSNSGDRQNGPVVNNWTYLRLITEDQQLQTGLSRHYRKAGPPLYEGPATADQAQTQVMPPVYGGPGSCGTADGASESSKSHQEDSHDCLQLRRSMMCQSSRWLHSGVSLWTCLISGWW